MSSHPDARLDRRYSEPEAQVTSWEDAEAALAAAELFWLTTVRADGRPHCTPLLAVWSAGALHVSTGPEERKARNIDANPNVLLTTGCNNLQGGMDLVVEGRAVRVEDDDDCATCPQHGRRSTAPSGTTTWPTGASCTMVIPVFWSSGWSQRSPSASVRRRTARRAGGSR